MATFEKGILGGFSGKVGNVVGLRWRGKDVMRSLPAKSNYPATPLQEAQRQKFGLVIRFLTPIKSIVGQYFGKPQGDKSPFNLATGYHIREAIENMGGTYEMDFPKVLISKGDLRGMDNPQFQALANQQLSVTWDDNSGQGNASGSDLALIVVYAYNEGFFQIFEGVALREDGTATLNLPAFFAGFDVVAWAGFVTQDLKEAATSTYLGAVVVS
ncbi:DUF6266 family protein [Mangrovimonas xylaniphaga]|uniref:DUF6266 family protein n=1 Tax=Mangrovimonas xylaniphaga TaxID=1645915 RepID=UPI0006B45FDB|nr:DUF6266 family protein [Mangrovimonas xylaniphaga]